MKINNIFLISGILLLIGCAYKETPSERIKENISQDKQELQKDNTLTLIRTVVIKQLKSLSEKEKETVLLSTPQFAQYRMADSFGQYRWSWNLPTGHTLTANYIGPLNKINTEEIVIWLSDSEN